MSDQAKEMSYLERSLFGVRYSKLHTILPGLAVVIALALFCIWLSDLIGRDLMGFKKSPISAVMICLVIGLVINNVFKLPKILSVGFKFAVKKLLRFGKKYLVNRLSGCRQARF